MQEEMEHQQQTSLDGFGDNTFVDSPQDEMDSDFILSNKNINIIRTGFTKSSHLDINEKTNFTPQQFSQSESGNMEHDNGAAKESNNKDHINTYDKSKSSIGVNLRVTGQCCQGGRKYMEDFFSVAYQQTDNMRDLEYAFIGIYDGHGGSEAATFAKEHLMMEIINQKQFWSDSDQDVLRAIREGYIATHYAMWREQESWPKTTNGLLSTAGTTATIAFIRNEKIYIGHVGDSGVVLGYQNEGENFWRAKQLTTDHKPESPAERGRIMHAGGKVGVKSGVPRVVWTRPRNHGHRGPVRANTPVEEIPFLAVARSLGDLWSYNAEFNEFVVSPDPDVQVIDINPNTFRCLIFGTDGLWNVVSAQEAVDTVCSREKMNESIAQNKQANKGKNVPWINPSKGLVELALRTWSDKKMRADNTSVVTVMLYPPANNINKSATDMSHVAAKNAQQYKSVNAADFATLLDDKSSFQEISEKYLRPERFRANYENEFLGWSSTDNECMRGTNNWLWRCDTEAETAVNDAGQVATKCLQSFDELAKPRTIYTDATRIVDIENVEKINGIDHSDLYVNSFAETYNSLLDARNSKEQPLESTTVNEQSTTATTSTPLSSSSGLHMQQILQEQQMYQQQCMSGEDGYMLTTLETRRERGGGAVGMQSFKVFEADQSESSIQLNLREDSINYMVNTAAGAAAAESCDNEIKLETTITADKVQEKEIQEEEEEDPKLVAEKLMKNEELPKRQQKKCKSSCDETKPSLIEDEDGILEGARSLSPKRDQRFQRKCYVQITDVSYDEEHHAKIHTDFVEHIDEIEILADKPELVIESGPTTSKPQTRSATQQHEKQYFKNPPPFYNNKTPRPPPQGLRSYNGWMPGKSGKLPSEEEFSEFIRANMDYAAASAFSSFVDTMKQRFPGFNVNNTLFSKIFDPRYMRYHDFTINAKNRHTSMPNMFGKSTMPNKAGNNTKSNNKSGKHAIPTDEGEMIVNYFLLKQKQFAAKEKNSQQSDGADHNDVDDEDDDNPEELEYYESILATWLPLMDLMEDPEFQRQLLKNKDFLSCFETMPDWFSTPNKAATTNGTTTKRKTTTTTTTTTSAASKADTEKVDIAGLNKKVLDTKTAATKSEKEVQIPLTRTARVRPTTTTTATTTALPKKPGPKSSKAKPKCFKIVTETEMRTRASKRATCIDNAVGSTTSTTATEAESRLPVKRTKR